jgi:hypothetical protein
MNEITTAIIKQGKVKVMLVDGGASIEDILEAFAQALLVHFPLTLRRKPGATRKMEPLSLPKPKPELSPE